MVALDKCVWKEVVLWSFCSSEENQSERLREVHRRSSAALLGFGGNHTHVSERAQGLPLHARMEKLAVLTYRCLGFFR